MTDVRALQILLDGGVTDPRALFAAMPSGTVADVGRAIDVLSPMAFQPVDDDDEPGCDCQPTEWCDVCGTAEDFRLWQGEHREDR